MSRMSALGSSSKAERELGRRGWNADGECRELGAVDMLRGEEGV